MRRRGFIREIVLLGAMPALLLPRKSLAQSPFADVTLAQPLEATGGAAFTYTDAVFDGTNDYLSFGSNLTGVSDGKAGTCSFWFKAATNFDAYRFLWCGEGYLQISRSAGDIITVLGLNAAASTILSLTSTATQIDADGNWHWLMCAWDLAQANKSFIYIDGVDRTTRVTHTDDSIDYTRGSWYMGARDDGSVKVNGKVCEFYFSHLFSDPSVSANRDLFFNSGTSKPAGNLSTNGAPAPDIYFRTAVPDWESNVGGGGGFTENGTLVDDGDKP